MGFYRTYVSVRIVKVEVGVSFFVFPIENIVGDPCAIVCEPVGVGSSEPPEHPAINRAIQAISGRLKTVFIIVDYL